MIVVRVGTQTRAVYGNIHWAWLGHGVSFNGGHDCPCRRSAFEHVRRFCLDLCDVALLRGHTHAVSKAGGPVRMRGVRDVSRQITMRACVCGCVCGWVGGWVSVRARRSETESYPYDLGVGACMLCVCGWVGWMGVGVGVGVGLCLCVRARVCVWPAISSDRRLWGGRGEGAVCTRARVEVCVCVCVCVRACVFVCVSLKHRVPTRHAPRTCVVTRHLLKAPGYPRWLRRTHTREGVRCSCSTRTDFVTFLQLRPVSWYRRYERQAQPRPPRDCSCLGPRSGLQQCLQHARGCGIAHRARARAEAARRRVRRPGGSLRTSSGCRDGPPCAGRKR